MLVGLNYPHPWNVYGIYLGSGNPAGSQPGMDVWITNLKSNLRVLRDDLGIRVVRIFLLGNAANYGSIVPGPVVRDVTTTGRLTLPVALHPKVSNQLTEMFHAFDAADMLCIPSLIDFKAFGRRVVLTPGPRAVTNGCTNRHDIANDATIRRAFFDQVLRPFLALSQPFRRAVYAWEVQNEPIWNVASLSATTLASPFQLDVAGGATIRNATMKTFLQEAIDIIEGFPVEPRYHASVGHRFKADLASLPTGRARQFHYYPVQVSVNVPRVGPRTLVVADRNLPTFEETRAFLGEIAAGPRHGSPWPELRGADTEGTRVRVFERLKHARSKGYPLTLLWPDVDPGAAFPGPDPIKLSADAQDGIKDFQRTARGHRAVTTEPDDGRR